MPVYSLAGLHYDCAMTSLAGLYCDCTLGCITASLAGLGCVLWSYQRYCDNFGFRTMWDIHAVIPIVDVSF